MIQKINKAGVCAPLGFLASAVNADVKGKGKDKKDLCLLYSEVPFKTAAVFTANTFKAAPLRHAMELMKQGKEFQAVLVNSGNANACTGALGIENCETLAQAVADSLGIDPSKVLTGSTGTIGVQLPVDRMVSHIETLADELDDGNSDLFAEAIMTTDTFPKQAGVLVETANGAYVVAGVTKGAGMIAPNMATMLCYITTDAMVNDKNLQAALDHAVKGSFNSITVDNDMSTNDTVFLMANGMSGIIPDMDEFKEAVATVCLELAKMIVKDGEGATKFITVNVKNASTEEDAKKCAFLIANSPLVKTMFHGEDPNWGRLMACVGASGVKADESTTDLYFEDLLYAKGGLIIDPAMEPKAAAIMKQPEISITLDLNTGSESATVYTCDLSREYIAINADYRS
ncbi:bifunctional glutamate N-acetyltransferase/amino-acid acetyltransferase ArgJ [Seleniivibrio woodruffii]|uniref:Arginine biosynthesis bifunctional protein ArgJ n=1 Tax=Seleniivibrio woodruffii TaxID=1078050 RepID=A0A4R1K6U8_9BACT|nr:bifunctional glutamate N-acetyltransferase/amino-acid acetyltransferase ArgJ [Seleniivibrio woodruffii]TCK59976.1 glutamate N-acetyltransferase [Seleniivibrio woodruffii]TVZ35803.1 glutamate N-acetyltransferase [Seleniivibrio woodruffii]